MMPWWLCRTESFWLWRTNGGERMLVVNSPLKFPRVLLSNFVPCSWTLWSHQDLELTIDNLRYPNYTEGHGTQCTRKCMENKTKSQYIFNFWHYPARCAQALHNHFFQGYETNHLMKAHLTQIEPFLPSLANLLGRRRFLKSSGPVRLNKM